MPLLALGVAAIGWSAWSRDDEAPSDAPSVSTAPTPAITRPTLVVMPLKAIGGSGDARVIADGLSEELICSLTGIEGLRVIAQESTRLATSETDQPARLVQRLGITHALEGNLQQAGQSLRIRLRLVDARGGGTLWTKDFDRDASEVLQLQRDIARQVADSLALRMGLAGPATRSGDATFLRRFLAAQALVMRSGASEEAAEAAVPELRALLRERPDDAQAHATLAVALNIRAMREPALPASVREEALQEARIAQRLDPSLPEPYAVQGYAACLRDEWESCLSLMETSDARGSGYPFARYNRAMALARLGYLDRAEAQARELVARDPLNTAMHSLLGRVLDTRGRHEEAKASFARVDPQHSAYGRWFNAVWRDDRRAAEDIVAGGLDPGGSYGPKLSPSYRAVLRALDEPAYWPQAEAVLREFERDTGLFSILRVLAPDASRHAPELIAGLADVRERDYSGWDLLLWNPELAFLRRDPAFQDYLRDNGILAYWRKHGFPEQCRPRGDGALCD